MTNYTSTITPGIPYVRAKLLMVHNPLNSIPRITALEEQVVTLSTGELLQRDVNVLDIVYDSLTGSVPMLDPTTGLPTGTTMTHAEIYAVLYSVYFQAASIRDSELPVPEVTVPPALPPIVTPPKPIRHIQV